jgi:predicted acyltransferase
MNDAVTLSPERRASEGQAASKLESGGRVVSLDQFRGYTVLGMILVNFIGGFAVVHSVFKHNDNYFSYADSIMPSFHFAVGYAYRLTMLKRLGQLSRGLTYWSYARRSLALIFLAALLFGGGEAIQKWAQFSAFPEGWPETGSAGFAATFLAQWRVYLAHLLKSNLWNTFAIIGATQLLVLPLVATGPRVRMAALIGLGIGHALLCYWFNWGFVRGDPANWMVQLWRTGGDRSWDGGFFGPLCWAVPMLGGTLAYDLARRSPGARTSARRLFGVGAGMMVLAYLLSCPTRLFDVKYGAVPNPRMARDAANPFIPAPQAWQNRTLVSLLAEPPFVAPPPSKVRLENYWMMCKQIPTLSFIWFAAGFAFALYGLFVMICDIGGWQCGVFRTFGTNPLAAYCLHEVISFQFSRVMPPDSPLWYCTLGFAAFFAATYVCVRALEKARIFIRL